MNKSFSLLLGFLGFVLGLGALQFKLLSLEGYFGILFPFLVGLICIIIGHLLSKKISSGDLVQSDIIEKRSLLSTILLFLFFISLIPLAGSIVLFSIAALSMGFQSCSEVSGMAGILCIDVYKGTVIVFVAGAISGILYYLSNLANRKNQVS